MASGEDQAIKILQGQVESLTAQLQTLTSERDEYRDALTEVSNDRDTLRKQIGNPDDTLKELASLKQQIRDRTHLDKFSELAKGEKAKEAAIKHLWKLAEYKAESDEPDEAALKGILKKLKAEADYAFDAADSPNKPPPFTIPNPPGSGRSGRNDGGDGTVLTPEMRANPVYMLSPGRQAAIAADIRARNGQTQPSGGPLLRG